MAINLSFVKGLWGKVGERTKLIGAAVLAFLLGSLWGGHRPGSSDNGRYVAWGTDGRAILDTRSGEIWVLDGDTHKFKRLAALPYF